VSDGTDRGRLRAQLGGHLERLRREGVWGLSIPEVSAAEAVRSVKAESPGPVEVESPGPVEAESSLRPVEAEALQCVACRLHETRTKVVFGVGDPAARLMFIGEGPGRDEDLQGEPFVGRAGQLLTKIIKAMGYEREDVYIANAVKCRPPQNRDRAQPECHFSWHTG